MPDMNCQEVPTKVLQTVRGNFLNDQKRSLKAAGRLGGDEKLSDFHTSMASFIGGVLGQIDEELAKRNNPSAS